MTNLAAETVVHPFTAFNFAVEITMPDSGKNVCCAAFSECDGLEISMDIRTIRDGGKNDRQIRLAGPVSYGQLTLKRGMTSNYDLWTWFQRVVVDPAFRTDAEVVILAENGVTERARFILSRCLPMKLRMPSLNAKDGMVAIEELQLAYESLNRKPPG